MIISSFLLERKVSKHLLCNNLEQMLTKSKEVAPQVLKQRKRNGLIFLLLVHFFFYLSFGLTLYALLTGNVQLIAFLIVLVIAQLPIKRSQKIIDYLRNDMHISFAFDQFTIIDDWQTVAQIEQQVSIKQRCIFPFHPHSVYAMGLLCSMNHPQDPAFSDLIGLSSNFALNMPIMGAIFKLWGVGSASSQNVKELMKEGKNIGLLPGGFEEATITSPNELRCWITHRKGFIKYALQYNYTICPVIVLGEHQAFWTFQPLEQIRLLFNKIKIPGVLFWNKQTGLILPTTIKFTVIRGKPINHSKECEGSEPSQELIDRTHKQYMEQIQRLYSKYKSLNGGKPLKFY